MSNMSHMCCFAINEWKNLWNLLRGSGFNIIHIKSEMFNQNTFNNLVAKTNEVSSFPKFPPFEW